MALEGELDHRHGHGRANSPISARDDWQSRIGIPVIGCTPMCSAVPLLVRGAVACNGCTRDWCSRDEENLGSGGTELSNYLSVRIKSACRRHAEPGPEGAPLAAVRGCRIPGKTFGLQLSAQAR